MRAAVRDHLAIGPATRMLAFAADALDPDDTRIAHLALCSRTPWPQSAPSVAVAVDPLRLPFIEALFDAILVAGILELSDAPSVLLREVRRVAAPAASIVLVVPRRRLSFNPLPGQHYPRARLERLMVEAMLEPVDWRASGGLYVIRARPRGGAAPALVGRAVAATRPGVA